MVIDNETRSETTRGEKELMKMTVEKSKRSHVRWGRSTHRKNGDDGRTRKKKKQKQISFEKC